MANNNKQKYHNNYNLDLTLGLRPIEIDTTNHGLSMSKHDKQALRRREAKLKREYKRKAQVATQEISSERHNAHFVVENRCSVSNDDDIYYCNSAPGGSSSDTSSHSSHPPPNLPTATSTSKQPASSQQEATSNYSNHNLSQSQLYSSSSSQKKRFLNLRPPSKFPECATPTNTNIIHQTIELPSKKAKAITEKHSISNGKMTRQESTQLPEMPCITGKPNSSNSNSQSIETQSQKAEAVTPKPSNNNGTLKRQESGPLSQMPCVTTTGNGPKGNTITGFLYKYTKKEVIIVCVCHGTSFSPAGFVEHAGGVDVEHPLKHIKVAPFALS